MGAGAPARPGVGRDRRAFPGEYGLVRTLSDEMPPRSLPMERWAYLGAHFPMGSFPPVGAELDYFTTASPEGLRSHGFQPKEIAATRDAFYEALATGNFDVLHISCHAESPHQSIERANLILGDETAAGDTKPRLIEVETTTVAAEARLRPGRPLVFVNACETGRVGASADRVGRLAQRVPAQRRRRVRRCVVGNARQAGSCVLDHVLQRVTGRQDARRGGERCACVGEATGGRVVARVQGLRAPTRPARESPNGGE